LIGTPDDGTSDKCNYSDAPLCVTAGNPTTGAYSYARLDFVQDASCALGAQQGAECTSNADCGGFPCAPCNPPSKVGLGYFAKNPSAGGGKGLGTMTASACDNGFSFTELSVGTSEVVGSDGGGCLTLGANSTAGGGCGVGPASTTFDMKLWVSTVPGCGFPAGTMPDIDLAGQIMAGPTGSAVCGYTPSQVTDIMTDAGIGSGSYLMIVCGNGTLPTDLEAACLPGAAWDSILVAKTSTDIATSCGDACSSGCMAGTAEGVE
jgi:hypothetical protein